MLTNEFRERLSGLTAKHGGRVGFDAPLKEHTTIGIGGTADAWYEPFSPEELREAKILFSDMGVRTVMAGNASNILFPDGRLEAVVINLSAPTFKEKNFEGEKLTVGSGAPLGGVISDCCKAGLGGFEGLVGIPGTIGGALKMNAGYKTTISDLLERALVMTCSGELKWMDKTELVFGYRSSSFAEGDIILEAVFGLERGNAEDLAAVLKNNFREKMEKQPLDKKTLGSVFKNPTGSTYKSAQMIDLAGFRGKRRGGAGVTEKHANFIENAGGAKAADVTALISEIRNTVRTRFAVELETEIEIL